MAHLTVGESQDRLERGRASFSVVGDLSDDVKSEVLRMCRDNHEYQFLSKTNISSIRRMSRHASDDKMHGVVRIETRLRMVMNKFLNLLMRC